MSLLSKFIFLLLIFFIKFFKSILNILIVFRLYLWLLSFYFGQEWFDTFSFLRKLLIFPVLLFLKILKNHKRIIGHSASCNFLTISFDLTGWKITKLQFHRFDFFIQLIFYSFNFCVIILLLLDNYLISNNFTQYRIFPWCH